MSQDLVFKARPWTFDTMAIDEVLSGVYTEKFGILPTDQVADVGAMIGVFAVLAARQAYAGHVWAFEPHPDNFELLKENIRLNNLSNVTAVKAAVLDAPGITTMPVNLGIHTGAGMVGTGKMQVPAVTLDDSMSKLDFLKVDAEGSELKVLQGAARLLQGNVRIAMEVHPGMLGSVTDLLQSLGYTVESKPYMLVNHLLWAHR